MTQINEKDKFALVAQRIDPRSRLLCTWDLKGGVSAQVTALEIERPDGQNQKVIVRRYGDVDLQQNPHIAADEWRLLRLLQCAGLSVPASYYFDESGEIFSRPYVILEYIEGTPESAPSNQADAILQLATHLWRIHNVDCANLDLSFLPRQEERYTAKLRERPAMLDDSLDEGRIRDTLEASWPLPRRNRSVLLHGDFWPGNILWKDGRLVAVIDWEDAAIGDPLADVANGRLEVLWAFGIEAMHSFTEQYASMATLDWTNLPYWDLCAALRPAFQIGAWASDDIAEITMREGHRWFITQAFEKLSAR